MLPMTPRVARITIITSTLDCAESLRATAESIGSQTHRNVQWIVADGGSGDGTVDVLRRLGEDAHWFSEPDTGIYDAWNKACRLIDGEWVLFLGAGDVLAGPAVLSDVARRLEALPDRVSIAYGNVVQLVDGRERYRYGEVQLDAWQLCRPALPAHQGVFHRARLLERSRPFDDSYRVVADSKLLLQVIRQEATCYLGIDVTQMEPGGVSSHPASTLKVMREFLRLEADLGYRIPRMRKIWYVFRNHAKASLYKVAGPGLVDRVIRFKRSIGIAR